MVILHNGPHSHKGKKLLTEKQFRTQMGEPLGSNQSRKGIAGESEVAVYSIATAVSELANNLFFHTSRGGTISLSVVRHNGNIGLEIMAEDEGPGIADVKLAMQDGFTTNGGLGGGLPSVERLMDEFEIKSQVGAGTRVMARMWGTMQNEK